MNLLVEKLFPCRTIASSTPRSGKSVRPTIDRDVISSSTDLAISTSLMQCMVIGCSQTNLSPEVDFPAVKFHRVRKCSKIQVRNRNSRIIYHTTVRISSTSMIQHATSSWEVGWRNRRIQRFSFHFTLSSPCSSGSVRPQFLRRWCQIHWIVEECGELSFLSRWSCKKFPVVPIQFCVSRGNPESRRDIRLVLGMGQGWLGTWVALKLLPDSGS